MARAVVVFPHTPGAGSSTTYRLNVAFDPREDEGGLTPPARLARFLMQATFGQTRAELSELQALAARAGGVEAGMRDWLHAQTAMPPSLHRAHYRKHVNPRLRHGSWPQRHTARKPCDPGSRWIGYAFTKRDIGKVLEVADQPAPATATLLSVDGVPRTEVDRGAGTAFNFSVLPRPIVLCSVREGVQGTVVLGDRASCSFTGINMKWLDAMVTGPLTIPNPPIRFTTTPSSDTVAVMELQPAEASFVPAAPPLACERDDDVPGQTQCNLPSALLLQNVTARCALPTFKPSLIKHGGTYYFHDVRLNLVRPCCRPPQPAFPLSVVSG
jgi:hypothetical protein